MKYLIEVVADCNDGDYITNSYIGTDVDVINIKKVKWTLKYFQNKLTEICGKSTLLSHGQTIDAIDHCLYALVGNNYHGNREFLEFVKQNQNDAEFLIDWANKHWPSINTMLATCHTLIRVSVYKLMDSEPLTLYWQNNE